MPFEETKFSGLRAQMAKYGHNQSDLAKVFNKSIGYINSRLNGRVDWSLTDINTLCELYNVSFEELFK